MFNKQKITKISRITAHTKRGEKRERENKFYTPDSFTSQQNTSELDLNVKTLTQKLMCFRKSVLTNRNIQNTFIIIITPLHE